MTWNRYVAVGDSFTEGLEDGGEHGRHRGWADRVADRLAEGNPDFSYGNLAIRGRKVPAIVNEQIPAAIAMEPDLISVAGGVNDAMRAKWDLAATSELVESGVVAARASGADVLLVSFGNPSGRSRLMGTMTNRLAGYRQALLAIADEHGCYMLDFWNETMFNDPRFWAEDRLHLNSLGHERAAGAALELLGLGDDSWRDPLPPARTATPTEALRGNLMWTGKHLAPWVGRRLLGQSSGDSVAAKRPTPESI